MGQWSVTPNNGVVDLGNGNFRFPKNETENDITYTITYTDDNNCTGSTSYTVPKCDKYFIRVKGNNKNVEGIIYKVVDANGNVYAQEQYEYSSTEYRTIEINGDPSTTPMYLICDSGQWENDHKTYANSSRIECGGEYTVTATIDILVVLRNIGPYVPDGGTMTQTLGQIDLLLKNSAQKDYDDYDEQHRPHGAFYWKGTPTTNMQPIGVIYNVYHGCNTDCSPESGHGPCNSRYINGKRAIYLNEPTSTETEGVQVFRPYDCEWLSYDSNSSDFIKDTTSCYLKILNATGDASKTEYDGNYAMGRELSIDGVNYSLVLEFPF